MCSSHLSERNCIFHMDCTDLRIALEVSPGFSLWCCFCYFIRNSLVALLAALFARNLKTRIGQRHPLSVALLAQHARTRTHARTHAHLHILAHEPHKCTRAHTCTWTHTQTHHTHKQKTLFHFMCILSCTHDTYTISFSTHEKGKDDSTTHCEIVCNGCERFFNSFHVSLLIPIHIIRVSACTYSFNFHFVTFFCLFAGVKDPPSPPLPSKRLCDDGSHLE